MEMNQKGIKPQAKVIASAIGGSLAGALLALGILKQRSTMSSILGGALGLGSILGFEKAVSKPQSAEGKAFVAAAMRSYVFGYTLGKIGQSTSPEASLGGVVLGFLASAIVSSKSNASMFEMKSQGYQPTIDLAAAGTSAEDQRILQFIEQHTKK